jgi:hypothetical protein
MQRKTQELITAPNSDPLKLWEEKLEDHLLEIFLGLYAVVFLMFKMWGPRYRIFPYEGNPWNHKNRGFIQGTNEGRVGVAIQSSTKTQSGGWYTYPSEKY